MPSETLSARVCTSCGASIKEGSLCSFCGASYEIEKSYTKEEIFEMYPGLKRLEDAAMITVEVVNGDQLKIKSNNDEESAFTVLSISEIEELSKRTPTWITDLVTGLTLSQPGIVDHRKAVSDFEEGIRREQREILLSSPRNFFRYPLKFVAALRGK